MIYLEVVSALTGRSQKLTLFNSYNFDRSVLTPAAAFRFTAPGVDKKARLSIRSGDTVRLLAENERGKTAIVATGFIDETDTHITATNVEYVLTGRDVVGQLVDNHSVDISNKLIVYQKSTIDTIVTSLLANTRITKGYKSLQLDKTLPYSFSTNVGETKINTLQRYLEFMNGLVWADNDGSLIVDKPNFTRSLSGSFTVSEKSPQLNNVLESRVRRNVNQAIRQIVYQLDKTQYAGQDHSTLQNMDKTVRSYQSSMIGRSVSELFNYAGGTDTISQSSGVGHGSFKAQTYGQEYAAREVARDNMRVLDVEVVVEGHFNKAGFIYNVDQIYQVTISDENVAEPMYVYSVSYELTLDHGMMTRMRLCRLYTICAYSNMLDTVVK